MTAGVAGDSVAAGRAAFDAHEWAMAFEHLRTADTGAALSAEDLERLAQAARWSRHYPEMLDAFERAEAAYAARDDRRGAARAALELAWEHNARGDDAVTAGWFGRATTLLEADTDCAEYAMLLFVSGFTMLRAGNHQAGRDLLEEARDLARRVGSPDVEGLARIYLGHALVAAGDVTAGFALVDEATAAAMSGELGVQAAGAIYCSTIFLCRNTGDWRRAGEWTDASLRWCERESVSGYPGLCRFHRAEVMRFRGALDQAERDSEAAIEELLASAPRYAAWAYHELGEVRRRRGDRPGARAAFRQSSELGFDPQPGLALLHLDEGDIAAAQRAVRRAIADDDLLSVEGRGHVLPAQVTIEIAAGELDAAGAALAALEARVDVSGSAAFAAAATTARGEIALAERRVDDAVRELRRAWQAWRGVEAPYEGARARALLAETYRVEGDEESARLELEAARAAFARIGAAGEAERLAAALAEPVPETRAVRTFMFTDIVDSTKLVEAIGDTAWDALLAWHDRTLRACFEAHEGREVKHEGDGFFVAFADARCAVDGACAIQRSLAEHRRDHGFAPQVRIGLHTAEATERGDDYTGRGVHTSARIAAAARAGEILVSRDVLEAAGNDLAITDARALELKGLATPVEVVSFDWGESRLQARDR
ncbi:MAG: adenylate/guanylate cyclase domain-containing protein [Acidimicrobiia bacterium]